MSIKIASMNFGDCDTILHNTPNGMKNIAEVLGPNGEVYWSATKELTGIPPLSIRSNGTMLLDYLISGNMSQTGTPTPTTPIQPQETGDRTGNLVEVSNSNCIIYSIYNQFTITNDVINITGNSLFGFIAKCSPNTQYTVSSTRTGYNCDMRIREYSDKPSDWTTNFITQSVNVGLAADSASFTTNSETKYILVCFFGANVSKISNIMLNTGSTALPYENFGYKIPISSANTTTPVYLGEVQTTRRIRKKTFNGSESFSLGSVIGQIRFDTGLTLIGNAAICSHYILKETYSSTGKPYIRLKSNALWFELDDTGYETKEACLADFITYLQQQYSNGTPVCVWYVLATPTTDIVNEPLRKIGDYADTLSYEQAGVQIPTNRGNTVIDVDTTLKLSQMYIKYK